MTQEDGNVWLVRAGRGAEHAEDFATEGYVGISWMDVGPVSADTPDDEIERGFERHYPEAKPGTRAVWVSQLKRFLRELQMGDSVVTYDSNQRIYLIGTIGSEPKWREARRLGRIREVAWEKHVHRDLLSTPTKNSLGSIATLFRVSDDASAELFAKAVPISAPALPDAPDDADEADEAEPDALLHEETVRKSGEFIQDRIAQLSWQDMQRLVAGILRAMGYKTRVANGPDRGVDVFASPDGLGLQEPRIFVEVKHRKQTIGAPDIRAFLGGRRTGDKCLYVSSGGFTKEARYEADRASVPLTLINLEDLSQLLVDHYERADMETQALVRLTKLYWPA